MLPQYTELLDPERQIVFNRLKQFAGDYILACGTAIMLQIGHRFSYDFDCFTKKELSPYILIKAKKVFGVNLSLQFKSRMAPISSSTTCHKDRNYSVIPFR